MSCFVLGPWDLGTLGWLDPAYPSEDWLQLLSPSAAEFCSWLGDVFGDADVRAGLNGLEKNGTMQIIYDSPLSKHHLQL